MASFFSNRLEILNKELNAALSQFSRSVDDSDLTQLAKKQWLKPLAVLIGFLCVIMFAVGLPQLIAAIKQLLRLL
jgi:hypothetical protein